MNNQFDQQLQWQQLWLVFSKNILQFLYGVVAETAHEFGHVLALSEENLHGKDINIFNYASMTNNRIYTFLINSYIFNQFSCTNLQLMVNNIIQVDAPPIKIYTESPQP